jgi:mannose-6-phosphate isomerase
MSDDQQLTQGIYQIKGKIFSSPYDWGGNELIPEVLGFTPEPGVPYAEYWLGAHKRGPSPVELPGQEKTLEEIIAENSELVLGHEVSQKYGELPYLFKLADAKIMLSVQVHPNKQQALEGFEKEEKTGIPATDLKRTFKDKNSKTEMVVALRDFWCLHGLQEEQKLLDILNKTKELSPLIDYFTDGDYKKLYLHVLQEMSDQEVSDMLTQLAERVVPLFESNTLTKDTPDYWAAKAIKDFKMQNGKFDRGIFSIYFLNLVHLEPGQALFQGAGVLHSFLEGQYIEVMQNSDNIARAGATNKPIDLEGFEQFTIFKAQEPKILNGETVGNEIQFKVPADEYLVSKIHIKENEHYNHTTGSVEILIGLEGNATITANGTTLPLSKGNSVVVFADTDYVIKGNEKDVVYKTSVPQN